MDELAHGPSATEIIPAVGQSIGRTVGRYELLSQIGRGGMAVVYLARQNDLDRVVAVKQLSVFDTGAHELAERFLSESRLAGSLSHPNIVTVHEYFEEAGIPYIAMEYIPRGSLRPWVGKLSLPQLAGVLEGVLAGLAHAEPAGIVHRDLKPENIMVSADGTIKIADFGIAKATQTTGTARFVTATGIAVGTPEYMAPEQAGGEEIGAWTDLYSVGVIAHELLVGHTPFEGSESPMVILMRHLNERIPSVAELNPDVDPALSDWVDRLLVKDPHQRTPSATQAWEELEEIILKLAGPRWRRQGRLPEAAPSAATSAQLSPAPLKSRAAAGENLTSGQSRAGRQARSTHGRRATPLKVFINYRREDGDAIALLLYDRLVPHLGSANVFLDVKALEVGRKWMEENSRDGSAGVCLALIGRTWLENLKLRQPRTPDESEDLVALELEFALERWPRKVIPILIGDASLPDAAKLPRPLRRLAACQTLELHHGSFDEDTRGLIARLRRISAEQDAEAVSGERVAIDSRPQENPSGAATDRGPSTVPSREPSLLRPGSAHYETILKCMVEEGTVVPVLGSRVRGALPDAEQLAAHLEARFRLGSGSRDLAEIAQHIAVAEGPSFLHKAMKDALRKEPELDRVHRFLARLPKRLAELGRPARHQMIVSTNYDAALERAFDDEGEPYDLAVFVARGVETGSFLHIPWRGEPRLIADASKYREFPIDPYDELERSVIVKVLGAAEGGAGDYRWDRSYVITEDQYIDYLVTDQVASVVPLQILNKLTSSHCLFLGYAMRDWSLRVFIKRIWRGRTLEDKSWAIEHEPDTLEKDFWNSIHVELLSASPTEYVEELDARMTASSASGA
jgi:hypothetical protein